MYPSHAKFNFNTKPKTLLNFNQVFKLDKVLGAGGFGKIYKVIDKISITPYALKILHQNNNQSHEIEMLILLSKDPVFNKDISIYVDSFLVQKKFGVLMEYIDGVDITKYYQQHKLIISQFVNFATWLLKIVMQLHNYNIVHRDIKPANIMIDKHNHYKLIDFDLSCQFTRQQKLTTCKASQAGTPVFTAPEVWQLGNVSKHQLNEIYKKADVYAIGVTLYTIVTNGKLPYQVDQRGKVIGTKYQPLVSQVAKLNYLNHIIKNMTNLNYHNRWTAKESLRQFQDKIVNT